MLTRLACRCAGRSRQSPADRYGERAPGHRGARLRAQPERERAQHPHRSTGAHGRCSLDQLRYLVPSHVGGGDEKALQGRRRTDRLIDHPHFAFGLDPGGCEVVDCAGPTACACGTRLTLLELFWWVRVAHCAWLLFVSFAYFTETPGCEVSGPQPAILLAYAFHAWRIVMKL
jgi:hypothetical protein